MLHIHLCCAFSFPRVERLADAGEPTPRAYAGFARRRLLDFFDDPAADHNRVRVRGDRTCARCVANAKTDAHRKTNMAANVREPPRNISGVQVAGARYALERDVIN